MSSAWPTKSLGDVVGLRRGFDLPNASRVDGPYPIISAGAQVGTHHEAKVQGPGFAVGRATNLGVPQWSDSDFWPLNTTLYAADFKGNDPRWLYRLFQVLDLTGFDSGSVQPMLNRNYIAQVPVLVPTLPEQQRIAEVLGALDDKIAVNGRTAEFAVLLCESLVSEVFSSASLPLGEVAEVIMGSSPKGEYLNEVGDGVAFFQGVRDFGLLSPTRRVFATQPVRMAQAGDVLFAVRAPVGEVNVANETTCIGRGLAALRAHENPVSFFYTMRANSHVWNEFQGTGTVFASVNGKEVRQTRLPVIDQVAAPGVEERVSAMHARALGALAENEVLVKTRDELLPLLMSGKITVRDAEKRVQGVV
ncbi:restriction endonuclease subunit S [Dermacoccus nishinomiyaensis]|uniref:restriction endonuclease subunit S n=1 Tax=Dermacoccus nishinomiyaensis TaxID=1274 RepID=UPI0013F43CD4|nr:restriction endonuclease subunit S [Dermacoccus nishinomiyaensis]NHC30873.1 hypothetical protein [Dermacoccus nishinomiyaensis]